MPNLLNLTDAAATLQISPRTLRRFLAEQRGPRVRRIGRQLRFDPADLAEWVGRQ